MTEPKSKKARPDPISRWLSRQRLANRKLVMDGPGGHWLLRVSHRMGVGKKSPAFRIQCGDCKSRFDIYYGGETLEIAGVHTSVLEWRKLLLPLLDLELPGQGLETPAVAKALRKARPGKKWPVAPDSSLGGPRKRARPKGSKKLQ